MTRQPDEHAVTHRARPSAERAAAAARLAGAPAGADAVAARLRHAAHRATRPGGPRVVAAGGALAVLADPVALPAGHERPRHLRVVPQGLSPAQRRRRARALLMFGIGASAAIGLALVYFHVLLAQRQFAIDHLQSRVAHAQATYQAQRLEVAELGSPSHIVATAEGQLGMLQPADVTYVTPPPGSVVSGGSTPEVPLGSSGGTAVRAPSQAPAGDAAWPTIKSQLAGTP